MAQKVVKTNAVMLYFLLVIVSLAVLGCPDRDYNAYKKGYDKGYKEGRSEAVALYERSGVTRGFFVGVLIGGAIIAFFTRKYIAAEYRRFHRKRQMKRVLGACGIPLDPDIHQRVLEIGIRKKKLQDDLQRDNGRFVELFGDKMHEHLDRMGRCIVDLATLMQQLRNMRGEISGDEAVCREEISRLQGLAEQSADPSEKAEFNEAIAIQNMKLAALEKSQANARRSEAKLSTLSGFLDKLIIETANMRTLESHDVFEKFEHAVCREIEHLESVLENALADLASKPEPHTAEA